MAGQLPVAFLAGLLSFVAPCVLPLVPGYLSAVSAVEAGRLGEPGTTRRVFLASLPFVAGFTVLFVALGAGAGLVLGGLLTDRFDYRAIFWLVAILAAATSVLAWRLVPSAVSIRSTCAWVAIPAWSVPRIHFVRRPSMRW